MSRSGEDVRCCERCGRAGAVTLTDWPLLGGMAPPVLCGDCLAKIRRLSHARLRAIDASFDEERVADLAAVAQGISAELPERVEAVRRAGQASVIDSEALRSAIISLLELLSSPHGATHGNVRWASDALSRGGGAWPNVPEPFGELLRTMSGPMRGARWDPELAEAVGATPSQLLVRARRVP